MNKEEFLQELGEIMMLEEQLELSTELETLDAYDSMTHLTLLGIFEDEFGKEIESEDLIALKTVGDLVALAGLE
jgi:acyl carrier protein|tara:strand:- start:161 stop:382 length:222 start_codon:yes stop_codon:yes gene_type:complete